VLTLAVISLWLLALPASGQEAEAPEVPAEAAAAAEDPAPWELEGIRLGQTFKELDQRFHLRSLIPFELPPEQRYILEVTHPLSERARVDLLDRSVDRLELTFRDGRLIGVRVAYAGRAEILFDAMDGELRARFGEPASMVRRGPMSVGRFHRIRLYLWLSIWTWERPDETLSVEGKHYGVDKVKEGDEDHEYTFTLRVSRPE
jgi:hypothetical protein